MLLYDAYAKMPVKSKKVLRKPLTLYRIAYVAKAA